MKKSLLILFRFFLLLILVPGNYLPGHALRIEYGNTVVLSQSVFENVYVIGGTVTVNAPIHGDLIICGGTVVINDSILGDVLLAGGNLTLNGYVSSDVRGMGGEIHLSNHVEGDVVIAGGNIDISKNAIIGNLMVAGGKVTVEGTILKDFKLAAGEFNFNGRIGGNMDCRGDRITINGEIGGLSTIAASTKITVRDNAIFRRDVRYWVPGVAPDYGSSLGKGKAEHDPSLKMNEKKWYYLGWGSVLFLIWYMGMALLMIIAIQYFFPVTMHQAALKSITDSMKAFFRGLLFLLLTPLAILVLFITVIGIPIGLILLFVYTALIILASCMVGITAAHWYNERYSCRWTFWPLVFASFGFFVVFKLISLTPVLGWLFALIAVCTVFGAILLDVKWKRTKSSMV